MDVVPPELAVKEEGGVLYGRGTADAKSPLAAMIEVATQLLEEDPAFRVTVAGLVDEEGNNEGVKQLLSDGIDADYAIFGEPTNVNTITTGYKGGLLIEVTCTAESGHSSAPWLFMNTIEKAMEVWNRIKTLKMPQERPNSRFFSLSKNLRHINGGRKNSVTPSHCTIQVGVRIPPGITVNQLEAEITRIVEGYRIENPEVEVDMAILDHSEPYLADRRSKVVKALSQAIYVTTGKRATLLNKTGTGDMNIFGLATGIPVVTYGPGDSHLDHTPHEHIFLEDYHQSIKVLKEALRRLVHLHNR
jgi:LysW-gamma-L-lysine carboxypeptidase